MQTLTELIQERDDLLEETIAKQDKIDFYEQEINRLKDLVDGLNFKSSKAWSDYMRLLEERDNE